MAKGTRDDHDRLPPDEEETRFAPPPEQPGDATRTTAGEPTPLSGSVPESIGPYRILGKLGEGGMGVVFEAEQRNPRRTVALKVVRGGEFVDEARGKLFQREADTLARLKHPNIGAIYESGRTKDGQHFFAMELVRGKTLDDYLSSRTQTSSLSPGELRFRLELLRKIADAVHYAHQRGVIHRDLKPSNVLVAEEHDDTVKILDFGLARITEGDVAAATMTTEVGVIKGTLPYMSPEQAKGDPGAIDVRTDVYALGVMLYEMLAGRRPYDVLKKSLPEAVRVICEESPRSLSQTIRSARRLDPDVETIVSKALEKEPDRRYASAAALAEDIGRYLGSQPIQARPPSTTYQLKKFAARNRALVGGVAATFLVLLAGVVVSTVLGLSEAAQRKQAEQARNDLESVVEFQSGMLSGVDPDQMGRWLAADLRDRIETATRERGVSDAEALAFLDSYDASMRRVNATNTALDVIDRNILDRAAQTLATRFPDQPLIAARLRGTIGMTYNELGLYERAEPLMEAALETQRRTLGEEDEHTLLTARYVAALYENQGRYDEAETLVRQCFETGTRVLGDEHPNVLGCAASLASIHRTQSRYDEAERLFRQVLETQRRLLGEDSRETLITTNNLANVYVRQRRYDEAEELYRQALTIQERLLGEDHTDTLSSEANLANLYSRMGRHEEAEPLFLRNLDTIRRVRGDDHPNTARALYNLALFYARQRRENEAEPLMRECLDTQEQVLGGDHPETLATMNNLGFLSFRQGRYDEAEPLLLGAYEGRRRIYGDEHPATQSVAGNLAGLYEELEETTKMVQLAETPGTGPGTKNHTAWVLLTTESVGRRDPAKALELSKQACAATNYENPDFLDTLSLAFHLNGDSAKAVENQKKAISLLTSDDSRRKGLEEALATFEAALATDKR